MFEDMKFLSKTEVHSRHHIKLEKYAKDIDIEAKVIIELVNSLFVPTGVRYQNELLESLRGLKEFLPKHGALKTQTDLLDEVSSKIDAMRKGVAALANRSKPPTRPRTRKPRLWRTATRSSRTSRRSATPSTASRGWFLLKNASPKYGRCCS